jgi:hypothetical protein
MKRYLAVLLVFAILSSASCGLLSGKTSPSPSPSRTPPSGAPSDSPGDGTPELSPEPGAPEAAVFLAGEPSAGEVGAYLKQNARDLPPEDADLLLERLLLLQLDITYTLNYKIWDIPYMTALNETLGGVFDALKLGNIKDEAVRADFQAAADGLITMVRYEETPVFETDWAALEAMKDVFSAAAADLITYQSRFQGRYYNGDPYKFEEFAEDIAAVEKLVGSTENGFARWELKDLYVRQVGRILHGAEGEWLFAFSDGDAAATRRIESFAETYAGTNFGAICTRMLEVQGDGPVALSAAIEDHLHFPPGDPRWLKKTVFDYSGAAMEVPQVKGLEDADAEDKVNGAISEFAKALVQPGAENQTVGYFLSFANDRYVAFCFTYNRWNGSGTGSYSEAFLTLDLETGDIVSLDDLVGKPFDEYKDALLGAMSAGAPADLKPPVDFQISSGEISILVPSETSDWQDYYTVTYNGLRSFMDVSKLY